MKNIEKSVGMEYLVLIVHFNPLLNVVTKLVKESMEINSTTLAGGRIVKLDNKNIWNFAQNKPSLVVNDIKQEYPFIDEDFLYTVLLKRGIFKWLKVRRDLIRLKDKWKFEIRELNRKKTEQEKGYLKALEKCRKEVRELCHSDRFVAPDFDKKANMFLRKIQV